MDINVRSDFLKIILHIPEDILVYKKVKNRDFKEMYHNGF